MIQVAILMGSDSDWSTMRGAAEALDEFGVSFEAKVLSAHRSPLEMLQFASDAEKNGFQVIIAGAGGAAHLPGMLAAASSLPVIGVPVAHGPFQGQDALLSIVQMPKGVPVACVAIGGAYNAGVLAVQMLASAQPELRLRVKEYKEKIKAESLKKKLNL